MTLINALPLFPLTSHLLPGGRCALRIFEPRYQRMVKESFKRPHAFALCMLDSKGSKDNNTHIWPLATLVDIIDFNQLEDGLLGITVEGTRKLEIITVDTETDGLRVGRVKVIEDWPSDKLTESNQALADKLKLIYADYPELGQLYPKPQWNNTSWLAQRWLELLPIEAEQKQRLWAQKPDTTLNFLQKLISQG